MGSHVKQFTMLSAGGKIINWIKLEIQKDCERIVRGIMERWKEDRSSHKTVWAQVSVPPLTST